MQKMYGARERSENQGMLSYFPGFYLSSYAGVYVSAYVVIIGLGTGFSFSLG